MWQGGNRISPRGKSSWSKTRYTAYGGARGGGKTHVLIRACIRGALQYPGIKILILRRTYPELEQTIIQPMNKLVNSATMDGRPCGDLIATYNGTMRMLFFHREVRPLAERSGYHGVPGPGIRLDFHGRGHPLHRV